MVTALPQPHLDRVGGVRRLPAPAARGGHHARLLLVGGPAPVPAAARRRASTSASGRGVAEHPRPAAGGPRRLGAHAAEEAEPYRAFAREFAPTVAAYDLHVEEHEEGPLAARLPAGRARARSRCWPRPGAAARAHPAREPGLAPGLLQRPHRPQPGAAARRRGAAGVDGADGRGLGLAARPHDLQPERARARVQPRGLAARARGPGTPRASRATDRLLRFQEGASRATTPRHRCTACSARQRAPAAAGRSPRSCERPGPALPARHQRGGRQLDPAAQPRSSAASATGCGRRSSFFRARPELEPVVRAHPDEAFIRRQGRGADGRGRARAWPAGAPNVLVIGGDEDVSSYALMPGLAGGLVWISSIGVGPGRARDAACSPRRGRSTTGSASWRSRRRPPPTSRP